VTRLFASNCPRTNDFHISQAVLCLVNLQHRCSVSQCNESGTRTVRQERELTTLTTATTQHGDTMRYLININSMTNYNYIRSLVHQHLDPPSILLNPTNYTSIRQAAVSRMNKQAEKRAEKRKQQKGESKLATSAKYAKAREHLEAPICLCSHSHL
jgi:hypothetical protein